MNSTIQDLINQIDSLENDGTILIAQREEIKLRMIELFNEQNKKLEEIEKLLLPSCEIDFNSTSTSIMPKKFVCGNCLIEITGNQQSADVRKRIRLENIQVV